MIGLNDKWSNESGRRSVVANQEYWTRTSFASGAQTIEVGIDGWESMGLSSKLTVSSAVANTTVSNYIFARNCDNASVDNKVTARLYSGTIRRNGTVIHDFIPCVKNGAAMLYDVATETFCANISGAGALVAGPEVDEETPGDVVVASAAVVPVRAADYAVKNAAEVRSILQRSNKVAGVFGGHAHVEGSYNAGGINYWALPALVDRPAAEGAVYHEVTCRADGCLTVTRFRV